jgi:CII-binding regulator of phage lambda lysogenization HflD
MPRYSTHERDIIETLQKRIERLERQVKHLQNPHHPTVHEFAKTDLPSPLTNGMIFIAKDGTFCWVRSGVARYVSGTVI